ncbi:MAG: hypothetical protein HY043_02745 [Verrucomicrobia bacterium]|nr:hypothetical protein [Verrucomicrobiota bacterium]
MSNCPDAIGLQQIGAATLEEFDRRVANIPQDLCAPFHHEAGRLETELLTIYKFVAMGARNEQDLAAVAASWKLMVEMCDDAARRLAELNQQHPACGADIYFDRMLDLRNKCERLKKMHH